MRESQRERNVFISSTAKFRKGVKKKRRNAKSKKGKNKKQKSKKSKTEKAKKVKIKNQERRKKNQNDHGQVAMVDQGENLTFRSDSIRVIPICELAQKMDAHSVDAEHVNPRLQ